MRHKIAGLASCLALFALAACAKDPFVVRITDCPAVSFVSHANTLTRFAPGRYGDAAGVTVTASLAGLKVNCDDAGRGVVTDISFNIIAKQGPAGADSPVALPYFVAIARDGDRLASKDVFTATVALTGPDGRGAVTERVRHSIPSDDLAKQSPHEVLIGFALNEDEAAYNVRQ